MLNKYEVNVVTRLYRVIVVEAAGEREALDAAENAFGQFGGEVELIDNNSTPVGPFTLSFEQADDAIYEINGIVP